MYYRTWSSNNIQKRSQSMADESNRASFTINKARLNRIGDGTRRGYKSGLNVLKKWLCETGNIVY